jgi:parallel beta-helix repeat protein
MNWLILRPDRLLAGGQRPASRRIARLAHPCVALWLVFGLLAGAEPARAATYYVDNENPLCTDTGPGTQATPYCTISAALDDHAGPGTTIIVLPGIYPEEVRVPGSGTSPNPLIIRGLGSVDEPVVVDGSDDFSNPALWAPYQGNVWRASTVNWAPEQVFADGARLDSSSASPGSLPSGSFTYVAGTGLYVNAGGGNPASHQVRVGHRPYGFYVSGRSWVTIEGFTVMRADNRGIQLRSASNNILVQGNLVQFAGRFGIQADACATVRILANTVLDNADHGISIVGGTTGSTIDDNESARNAVPTRRSANGIYLFDAPGNVLRRNRLHDNQDTGMQIQSGSNNNVCVQNLSWNNGDHGFDHLMATGNLHVGDVAYGNYKCGFSSEGNATGQRLFNCIAIENGLTTDEFNLWVDSNSTDGFESNDNIFWNSTSQEPVKFINTKYASVAAYSAVSGQDTRTIQADPRFDDPSQGDFRLLSGSPAIDNANSGVSSWPATDAVGNPRVDDPASPNAGLGPVPYADRGALEYQAGVTAAPPGDRILTSSVTPNPIRAGGWLEFSTSRPGPASVDLFDVQGRRVRNLLNDERWPQGPHRIALDGQSVPGQPLAAGIYFYRVSSVDGLRQGRFVIVR